MTDFYTATREAKAVHRGARLFVLVAVACAGAIACGETEPAETGSREAATSEVLPAEETQRSEPTPERGPSATSTSDAAAVPVTEAPAPTSTSDAAAVPVTEAPAPTSDAPNTAGLPPDVPGVYLAFTASSDRSVFQDADTGPLVLESSELVVALLNMDTLETGIIDRTRSKSYAKSRLVPITFDGRVYVVDETDGGSLNCQEIDPRTGTVASPERGVYADSIRSYAVTGADLYDVRYIDRLGQPDQTVMRHTDLSTGMETDLGDWVVGQPGTLVASAGLLYFITSPPDDGTPFMIYRIDPAAVSKPVVIAGGTITHDPGEAGYSWFVTRVSDGHAYWLAGSDRNGTASIEVWRYELGVVDGAFDLFTSAEVPLAGLMSVPHFDVDGHFVAVDLWTDDDQHHLMLHDAESGETQLHPLDVSPSALALLGR